MRTRVIKLTRGSGNDWYSTHKKNTRFYMCDEGVKQYFHVPNKADTIWLTISGARHRGSMKLSYRTFGHKDSLYTFVVEDDYMKPEISLCISTDDYITTNKILPRVISTDIYVSVDYEI